jgi:hypothetical protein
MARSGLIWLVNGWRVLDGPREGAWVGRNLMKTNLGIVDRVLRVVAGVAVIGVGAAYGSWWALLGLVPLGTGLVGFCPA